MACGHPNLRIPLFSAVLSRVFPVCHCTCQRSLAVSPLKIRQATQAIALLKVLKVNINNRLFLNAAELKPWYF